MILETPDLIESKELREKIKLFIVSPSYDQPHPDHTVSVQQLTDLLRKGGIECTTIRLQGDSHLPRARAQLAGKFLEAERYTHMLSVDDDQGFPCDVPMRLLAAVLQWGFDFVSAPVALKCEPARAAYTPMEKPTRLGDFRSVANVAFCFALVSRAMLEQMLDKYPEREFHSTERLIGQPQPYERGFAGWNPEVIDGVYVEGDHVFCHLWREMGGEVWLDGHGGIRHGVRHWGRKAYTLPEGSVFRENANRQEAEGQASPQAGSWRPYEPICVTFS